MSNKTELAVNESIEAPRILLIDEVGNRLGEFLTKDAIEFAAGRGLDLVEVQPNLSPPVCKIIDYGKMKYEKKKREKVHKKSQSQIKFKEIKMNPGIELRDLKIKADKARKILKNGTRVRVIVQFRGREIAHKEIGIDKCSTFLEMCEDISDMESPPKFEGKNVSMTLIPKAQPKVQP